MSNCTNEDFANPDLIELQRLRSQKFQFEADICGRFVVTDSKRFQTGAGLSLISCTETKSDQFALSVASREKEAARFSEWYSNYGSWPARQGPSRFCRDN